VAFQFCVAPTNYCLDLDSTQELATSLAGSKPYYSHFYFSQKLDFSHYFQLVSSK